MKTISSRDNPLVKRLHALAHSARERRQRGETLLDGAHLVEAAVDAQWPLKAIVRSQHSASHPEHQRLLDVIAADVPCYQLPDALFRHVSPVDNPSGLLAIIDLPASAPPVPLVGSVVVLDAVQDPGNLGTILRTAAAAGIRRVLLGAGCAQAWSPRVLRAGMGAHFVLELEDGIDLPGRLEAYPGRCLATALGEGACALYALDLRGPVAWLFGAEGQGLSPALLARADQRVIIPMAGGIESLNVGAAVAVCLFEQARQARAAVVPAH